MSSNPNSVFARPDVQVAVMSGRALMDALDVVNYLESLAVILDRDSHALAAEVVRQDAATLKERMAGDFRLQ